MPITPLEQVQSIRPKRDTFDFSQWDNQFTNNANKLRQKLNQFNLAGKIISDIRFTSFVYSLDPEMIKETVYRATEGYPEELQQYVSKFENIDDNFPIPLSFQMDEPVLIKFEDGTQFEVLTNFIGYFNISINQIPWNAEGQINTENINASILLDIFKGAKILNAAIITHPDDELGEMIYAVSLDCHGEENNNFSIVFRSDCCDYMSMQIIDTRDKTVLNCPFLQVKRSMYMD